MLSKGYTPEPAVQCVPFIRWGKRLLVPVPAPTALMLMQWLPTTREDYGAAWLRGM